jgi:hypothetical protein
VKKLPKTAMSRRAINDKNDDDDDDDGRWTTSRITYVVPVLYRIKYLCRMGPKRDEVTRE